MTVMVKLRVDPAQPLADGVTMMVAITGAAVAFSAVKAGIVPVPVPVRPRLVLLLVQLKLVPATVPESATAAVGVPLQTA